jgi:hypothetical protein
VGLEINVIQYIFNPKTLRFIFVMWRQVPIEFGYSHSTKMTMIMAAGLLRLMRVELVNRQNWRTKIELANAIVDCLEVRRQSVVLQNLRSSQNASDDALPASFCPQSAAVACVVTWRRGQSAITQKSGR